MEHGAWSMEHGQETANRKHKTESTRQNPMTRQRVRGNTETKYTDTNDMTRHR